MATRSRGGDPDENDDVATGRVPSTPTLFDRLRAGARPPTPAPTASRRTVKRVIERLDDRERWICFAASGLAVLTGLLIYVVETNDHYRPTGKGVSAQSTLFLGVAAGVLLLVATLFRRRAPVGFVSLFVFLAFGIRYFAGVPFLVLAVWLLYRSYQYQKEATANRRAAAADGPPSSSVRGRGSPGRSSPARPTSGGKGTPARKGPATPEANKRFTPKRPPPPPPKPTRRERKAAQASE